MRRGRLTVAGRVAVLVLLLGVVGTTYAIHSAWESSEVFEGVELPAVSAAPPPIRVDANWLVDPPRSRSRFALARATRLSKDRPELARLVEWLDPVGLTSYRRRGDGLPAVHAVTSASLAMRVEYSLSEELTEDVFEIMRRGRVERGQAIVLDPRTGRLLAYVSTDPSAFSPDRAYPAASIIKILTAATLLQEAPEEADAPCVYRGNKYRLNQRRLARPASGHETTLERALASSNNQCFSQWAVHVVGEQKLRRALDRFGWLAPAAPGHDAGRVEPVESDLDLGRLGSGLSGVRVNPLHVASLASILTDGRWIQPWWIDRVVDSYGRSLALPDRPPERRVLSEDVARRLRSMLVSTTTRGTAKSAFHPRRGRPLLRGIDVAGKTGNLTGQDPSGRYEWFLGLAPAGNPTIAVVVLQLQSNLWWSRSSELAAKVLRRVFCDSKGCRRQLAERWGEDAFEGAAPTRISALEQRVPTSFGD